MLSASVVCLIKGQYATCLLICYIYFTLLLVMKVIDQKEMVLLELILSDMPETKAFGNGNGKSVSMTWARITGKYVSVRGHDFRALSRL